MFMTISRWHERADGRDEWGVVWECRQHNHTGPVPSGHHPPALWRHSHQAYCGGRQTISGQYTTSLLFGGTVTKPTTLVLVRSAHYHSTSVLSGGTVTKPITVDSSPSVLICYLHFNVNKICCYWGVGFFLFSFSYLVFHCCHFYLSGLSSLPWVLSMTFESIIIVIIIFLTWCCHVWCLLLVELYMCVSVLSVYFIICNVLQSILITHTCRDIVTFDSVLMRKLWSALSSCFSWGNCT